MLIEPEFMKGGREMSEQYRQSLRKQIHVQLKALCALSNKEILSLDKYEELSEKVNNLLIYLDDLMTAWKTDKGP